MRRVKGAVRKANTKLTLNKVRYIAMLLLVTHETAREEKEEEVLSGV